MLKTENLNVTVGEKKILNNFNIDKFAHDDILIEV